MHSEKIVLIKRWEKEWTQLYEEILKCLLDHQSLTTLPNITRYKGKFDLRGINLKSFDFSDPHGSLKDICFDYASLWDINFSKLDLQGCSFKYAKLRDCRFVNSDLTGVSFYHSYLGSTNKLGGHLAYVQIINVLAKPEKYTKTTKPSKFIGIVDFSKAIIDNIDIRGAYFKSYSIFDLYQVYKIDDSYTFSSRGMINAREKFGDIRHPYDIFRILKIKYHQIGCRREAAKFYYLEMATARRSVKWYNPRRFLEAIFADALCGYGEKPLRVLFWIFVLVFIFTGLFAKAGVLIGGNNNLVDAFYFSLSTFTPLTSGSLSLAETYRIYEVIETILGIILIPLFIATLTRRIIPY